MEEANRIKALPPYLFARIEQKIAKAKEKGIDIISLGIGDPDKPTPEHIIQKLMMEAENPANHRYPASKGLLAFRQAVADFYQTRFDVRLDANREVVSLIGSKEGIAHINTCYVNPGDINLIPDPGYPVYGIGTLLADGLPYIMPLTEENNYLPELSKIPEDIAKRAKLMFINYPNNPTGALASLDFYKEVIAFAKKYDIIVCHDSAYSEMTFDGYVAPSFMEVEGAKDVGIEFGSLSKPYNMTGWRIGWAVGRADVIEALGRLKSNIDSGVFSAIQLAAAEGLNHEQSCVKDMQKIYQERRDVAISGLRKLGWDVIAPKATFYIWLKVPKNFTSASFAEAVLENAGVVITPGSGYGEHGEGYFRISLCIEKERIKEALDRMEKVFGKLSI
jgi:LL-diaminopimelate aminotransferase